MNVLKKDFDSIKGNETEKINNYLNSKFTK